MYRFLRNYSIKSIKDHKRILTITLIGQLIAIFLLSLTVFMEENIWAFSTENAEKLNHGDMAVMQTNIWFGEEQSKQRNIQFENYLATQTEISYISEQRLAPSEDEILSVEGGKMIEGDSYWYRWIDFRDIDQYSIRQVEVPRESVVLSKTLAKRLQAKEGDILRIYWGIRGGALLCLPVGAIVPDSEIAMEDANKGYLFLDLDYYKTWKNDRSVDYDHAWAKKYYIDGGEEGLKDIEKAAREIFDDDVEITYVNDIPKVAETFFSLPIEILLFFTILCFVVSGFGLKNLISIIVTSREKEVAILNVYGLSKARSVLFYLSEILIRVLPVGLFGVMAGLVCCNRLLEVTTSLGTFSLTFGVLVKAIGRIMSIYLLVVMVFTFSDIIKTGLRKPLDVLKDRGESINKKYIMPTVLWGGLMCVFLKQFGVLTEVLIKVIVGLFIVYLFFVVFMKSFYMFWFHGYIQLGIIFLRKNKNKVPMQIMVYTVCFAMSFITILFSSRLNHVADIDILRQGDYNVKISIVNDKNLNVEQFLEKERVENYYMIYAYRAKYENTLFELQVFDFDHYNGIMQEKISDQISVTSYFHKSCGLEPGSGICINIKDSDVSDIFLVGDISYSAAFMGGRSRAMAITKEGIELTGIPDRTTYFVNLSKAQKESLKEYAAEEPELMVSYAEDIVSNATSGMSDCIIIFNIISVNFFIVTIIVVLSGAIITYLERTKEFYIYFVYGATRNVLHRIMLIENIVIAMVGTICGTFISYSLFPVFSGMVGLELRMDIRWLMFLTGIIGLMSMMVTKIVLGMIKTGKIAKILKSE